MSAGGSLGLPAVRFGMSLGGFGGVVRGVKHVCVGDMRVVSRSLVVSRFVMRSSLAMMTCGMLVVFGGLFVMLNGVLGHDSLLG